MFEHKDLTVTVTEDTLFDLRDQYYIKQALRFASKIRPSPKPTDLVVKAIVIDTGATLELYVDTSHDENGNLVIDLIQYNACTGIVDGQMTTASTQEMTDIITLVMHSLEITEVNCRSIFGDTLFTFTLVYAKEQSARSWLSKLTRGFKQLVS